MITTQFSILFAFLFASSNETSNSDASSNETTPYFTSPNETPYFDNLDASDAYHFEGLSGVYHFGDALDMNFLDDALSSNPLDTSMNDTASSNPFGTGMNDTAGSNPFGTGMNDTAGSNPFGTGDTASTPNVVMMNMQPSMPSTSGMQPTTPNMPSTSSTPLSYASLSNTPSVDMQSFNIAPSSSNASYLPHNNSFNVSYPPHNNTFSASYPPHNNSSYQLHHLQNNSQPVFDLLYPFDIPSSQSSMALSSTREHMALSSTREPDQDNGIDSDKELVHSNKASQDKSPGHVRKVVNGRHSKKTPNFVKHTNKKAPNHSNALPDSSKKVPSPESSKKLTTPSLPGINSKEEIERYFDQPIIQHPSGCFNLHNSSEYLQGTCLFGRSHCRHISSEELNVSEGDSDIEILSPENAIGTKRSENGTNGSGTSQKTGTFKKRPGDPAQYPGSSKRPWPDTKLSANPMEQAGIQPFEHIVCEQCLLEALETGDLSDIKCARGCKKLISYKNMIDYIRMVILRDAKMTVSNGAKMTVSNDAKMAASNDNKPKNFESLPHRLTIKLISKIFDEFGIHTFFFSLFPASVGQKGLKFDNESIFDDELLFGSESIIGNQKDTTGNTIGNVIGNTIGSAIGNAIGHEGTSSSSNHNDSLSNESLVSQINTILSNDGLVLTNKSLVDEMVSFENYFTQLISNNDNWKFTKILTFLTETRKILTGETKKSTPLYAAFLKSLTFPRSHQFIQSGNGNINQGIQSNNSNGNQSSNGNQGSSKRILTLNDEFTEYRDYINRNWICPIFAADIQYSLCENLYVEKLCTAKILSLLNDPFTTQRELAVFLLPLLNILSVNDAYPQLRKYIEEFSANEIKHANKLKHVNRSNIINGSANRNIIGGSASRNVTNANEVENFDEMILQCSVDFNYPLNGDMLHSCVIRYLRNSQTAFKGLCNFILRNMPRKCENGSSSTNPNANARKDLSTNPNANARKDLSTTPNANARKDSSGNPNAKKGSLSTRGSTSSSAQDVQRIYTSNSSSRKIFIDIYEIIQTNFTFPNSPINEILLTRILFQNRPELKNDMERMLILYFSAEQNFLDKLKSSVETATTSDDFLTISYMIEFLDLKKNSFQPKSFFEQVYPLMEDVKAKHANKTGANKTGANKTGANKTGANKTGATEASGMTSMTEKRNTLQNAQPANYNDAQPFYNPQPVNDAQSVTVQPVYDLIVSNTHLDSSNTHQSDVITLNDDDVITSSDDEIVEIYNGIIPKGKVYTEENRKMDLKFQILPEMIKIYFKNHRNLFLEPMKTYLVRNDSGRRNRHTWICAFSMSLVRQLLKFQLNANGGMGEVKDENVTVSESSKMNASRTNYEHYLSKANYEHNPSASATNYEHNPSASATNTSASATNGSKTNPSKTNPSRTHGSKTHGSSKANESAILTDAFESLLKKFKVQFPGSGSQNWFTEPLLLEENPELLVAYGYTYYYNFLLKTYCPRLQDLVISELSLSLPQETYELIFRFLCDQWLLSKVLIYKIELDRVLPYLFRILTNKSPVYYYNEGDILRKWRRTDSIGNRVDNNRMDSIKSGNRVDNLVTERIDNRVDNLVTERESGNPSRFNNSAPSDSNSYKYLRFIEHQELTELLIRIALENHINREYERRYGENGTTNPSETSSALGYDTTIEEFIDQKIKEYNQNFSSVINAVRNSQVGNGNIMTSSVGNGNIMTSSGGSGSVMTSSVGNGNIGNATWQYNPQAVGNPQAVTNPSLQHPSNFPAYHHPFNQPVNHPINNQPINHYQETINHPGNNLETIRGEFKSLIEALIEKKYDVFKNPVLFYKKIYPLVRLSMVGRALPFVSDPEGSTNQFKLVLLAFEEISRMM